jgi:hypothetical protein
MACMFTDTAEPCVRKKLAGVRKFWVYSVFPQKIIKFEDTVPSSVESSDIGLSFLVTYLQRKKKS